MFLYPFGNVEACLGAVGLLKRGAGVLEAVDGRCKVGVFLRESLGRY